MATFGRSAQRNSHPVIVPLLIALGALAPAAAFADPQPSHDDVAYGDIPAAAFGATAAAAPADEAVADGHDDVSYGAVPRAAIALDLPTADEAVADGHDDVSYPTAEPQQSTEAAIATSGVAVGEEVRASDGKRVAAVRREPKK